MRGLWTMCVMFSSAFFAHAQKGDIQNVIIITTDGLRWQEVFRGMDSAIAADAAFNQKDSLGIFKKYWSVDVKERRKKLLPFCRTHYLREDSSMAIGISALR